MISSTEPREQAVSTAAAVQTSEILSFRETARVRMLILAVISSTEPRAQAVSTAAAAVQTSEMFGVLAVFEALHSLMLHDESSFCNTGTVLGILLVLVHIVGF